MQASYLGGLTLRSARSFIQPAMFDLELEATVAHLLGTNYFSPQPSAAIKFKDGGHNFRKEITEHPFAKITPALWANNKKEPDKLQDGSNSVGFREKLP